MTYPNGTVAKAGEFGVIRSYPAGMQLYGQDEWAADVFLIQNGIVKLMWADSAGRDTIIGLRWPGWFLGASSLILAQPHPASAITLVPSIIEKISGDNFLHLLNAGSKLTMRLHEAQSREIIEQTRDLGELACVPARPRLNALLQRLVRSVSYPACLPDGRLRLPLKKKELAALLSITPEYLSRTLDEMACDGAIATNGQWIVMRDVPAPAQQPAQMIPRFSPARSNASSARSSVAGSNAAEI
jgi:CRP/FNR family transcriptional regulator